MFSDPILNKLVKKYPAPHFTDRSEYLFEDLIESIISQQLSVKASDTIFRRFKALFINLDNRGVARLGDPQKLPGLNNVKDAILGGEERQDPAQSFPLPTQILAMPEQKIREAGISFQKISYIKNIATAFTNGEIKSDELTKMNDDEVILHLTELKGIGKWTAEMILIFTLNRPDVFSIGDLGLRRAVERLYGISTHTEILKLSENWKPHRSTASWYLWRSLENKK